MIAEAVPNRLDTAVPISPLNLGDIPCDTEYMECARNRLYKSIKHLSSVCKHGDHLLDVGGGPDFGKMIKSAGVEYDFIHRGVQFDLRCDKIEVPDNHYDIVISWEAIEHMWDIDDNGNISWDGVLNFWGECHRVLKPGGCFFLTTTNRICPRTYMTIKYGLCQQIHVSVCPHAAHVKELSGDEILTLMDYTGLEYVNYQLTSHECYDYIYDAPTGPGRGSGTFEESNNNYVKWRNALELFMDRPLKEYELYDTLFFTGWKPS